MWQIMVNQNDIIVTGLVITATCLYCQLSYFIQWRAHWINWPKINNLHVWLSSKLRFVFYMKNNDFIIFYIFYLNIYFFVLIRFFSQLKFNPYFGICNMLPFGFLFSQNQSRDINHVTTQMLCTNMSHHFICHSERRFLHKPCYSLLSNQCLD